MQRDKPVLSKELLIAIALLLSSQFGYVLPRFYVSYVSRSILFNTISARRTDSSTL